MFVFANKSGYTGPMRVAAKAAIGLVAAVLVGVVAVGLAQYPSPTVRVTQFGQKYHRAGCPYTRHGSGPISAADAESIGRRACKYCQPKER